MQASLGMTGTNMKLDLVSGRTLASSTDITLGQNALDGRLLGTAPLRLAGNELANKLEGNNGGNSLSGAAGNDTIIGGKGNDRIEGGTGDDRLTGDDGADSFVFVDQSGSTTGHDQITSLGSGDRIIIDLVGTLPSEATWERDHIAATTTGWRITLDDGATIDVTGWTLALLENTLTLA
jgi:Ca2+-binding RTX toxin-like protein